MVRINTAKPKPYLRENKRAYQGGLPLEKLQERLFLIRNLTCALGLLVKITNFYLTVTTVTRGNWLCLAQVPHNGSPKLGKHPQKWTNNVRKEPFQWTKPFISCITLFIQFICQLRLNFPFHHIDKHWQPNYHSTRKFQNDFFQSRDQPSTVFTLILGNHVLALWWEP